MRAPQIVFANKVTQKLYDHLRTINQLEQEDVQVSSSIIQERKLHLQLSSLQQQLKSIQKLKQYINHKPKITLKTTSKIIFANTDRWTIQPATTSHKHLTSRYGAQTSRSSNKITIQDQIPNQISKTKREGQVRHTNCFKSSKFQPNYQNMAKETFQINETKISDQKSLSAAHSPAKKKFGTNALTLRSRLFTPRQLQDFKLSNEFELEDRSKAKVFIDFSIHNQMLRSAIKRRNWLELSDNQSLSNFIWTEKKLFAIFKQQQIWKRNTTRKLKSKESINKMHNHFINNQVISSKRGLLQTMANYFTNDVFQYLPETYHLANGLKDKDYPNFLQRFRQKITQKGKSFWILKPGQKANQGAGIHICRTVNQIQSCLRNVQKYKSLSQKTYIIQQYIEKPFLYNGRKFSISHFMMISCINEILKGYWYEEGFIRTASLYYAVEGDNQCIHLTNENIQKDSKFYGKYEQNNKLSYVQLDNYIKKQSNDSYGFYDDILPKMRDITIDLMKASINLLDPERRSNNFELFGLDFILDEDLRVYLIDVNSNPIFKANTNMLREWKSHLLQDVLKLTIDIQYPPPINSYCDKGNNDFQNRFQLIYDSRIMDQNQLELNKL